MMLIPNEYEKNIFSEDELVTWHYQNENKQIPLPAVVVRQEIHRVIIKTYLQGKIQQFDVDPDQLMNR
ncbi:hypothetical protein ccbrp13_34890 [Ktedonobacteria bacterium brp13]|nr:hypothetical protein ccbrp13_34890 [Ktedonobacteria bacterium brp13]